MDTKTPSKHFQYLAFISHRNCDIAHANYVKKALLKYRLPVKTVEKYHLDSREIKPIFMYEHNLKSGGELPDLIKEAIDASKFMIVICSKNVKEKPFWIEEEIRYFLQSHDKTSIIPLVVDISAKPEEELYSQTLRELNITGPSFFDSKKGRHNAIVRIIATLLGIETDEIEKQDRMIQKKKRILYSLITCAFFILTGLLARAIEMSLFAPSIDLSTNPDYAEVGEIAIDDEIDFSLQLNNMKGDRGNILLQFEIPECIVPSTYCTVFQNDVFIDEIKENPFEFETEISRFLTGETVVIQFTAVFINKSLSTIQRNDLTIGARVKYENEQYYDEVKLSFTPEGAQIASEIVAGWGDNGGGRTTVSQKEYENGAIDNFVTFNRISDGVIGNELNFVGAREYDETIQTITGGNYNVWDANNIPAVNGQEYLVRMYLHNLCASETDNEAYNVKCAFIIPETSEKQIVVNGYFSSSNASPSEYWDSVVFVCDHDFHLEYCNGSALLENNAIGKSGGFHLSDSIVGEGTLIGYDALNGIVPGGYQYAEYVTIRVKVVYND